MTEVPLPTHCQPEKYQNLTACPFFQGNPCYGRNCRTVRWYYQNTHWSLERIARHFGVRRQTIWLVSKEWDLDWGKRRRRILARERSIRWARAKARRRPWWYRRLRTACWQRGIVCAEATGPNGSRWNNRVILNGRTVYISGITHANWTGRSRSGFSRVCVPIPFPTDVEFLLVIRKLGSHPTNFFLIPRSEILCANLQLPTARAYRRHDSRSYRSTSRWWQYQNAWHLLR